MTQFPKTLAAAQEREATQWKVGDALLKEIGPPTPGSANDGSRHRLSAVAAELLDNGIEYTDRYLGLLREVAHKFPPSTRKSRVSFSAHQFAQTPQFLEAVIASAPAGTKISQAYVLEARQAAWDAEERERRAALAEAKAAEEDAKAWAKEAKDEEERAAANAALEKARADKERNKVAPAKATSKPTPPDPENVPRMVGELRARQFAYQAEKLAGEARQAVAHRVKSMSPATVAVLTEQALNVARAWTEFANLVRSASGEKRGHLHAVEKRRA